MMRRFWIPAILSLALLLTNDLRISAQPDRTGNSPAASIVSRQIDLRNLRGVKTFIAQDRRAQSIGPETRTAPLRSGEYIVARWAPGEIATHPMMSPQGKAWSAGYGFIGVAPNGTEIRFRPVIETVGGLLVSENAQDFTGLVYVGLRDNRDPAAAYPLPQPISLLVSGQADKVVPRQLTIDHTNLPFAEVSIQAENPADSVEFSLLANGTMERAAVHLPVVRPRLELVVGRGRIQGLGLETSVVTVRAVGVSRPAGRVVTLASDIGSIEPMDVTLSDQGIGTATMRSVSIGSATLRALSPPLTPDSAQIKFSWPLAFFVASIVGGVAGALLSRIQRSGLPKKRSTATVLIRGVLSGVIVVALYAIGVNVLPIHPTANAGEVLAFAIAAVGGFVGLKIPSGS